MMNTTLVPELHSQHEATGMEAAVFGKQSLSGLDTLSFRSHLERKAAERRLLAEWSGLPENRILFLDQVHGADCVRVSSLDLPVARTEYAAADAIFTLERDVLLVVRTADCLPVFFHSEADLPICGVLHAGWKGLVRGIIRHSMGMVRHTMQRAGKGQSDGTEMLHLFPGPYIPGAVYEVGPDVACRFALTKPLEGGKSLLDLYSNARWMMAQELKGLSVSYDDPFDVGESGASLRDRFYSHRRGEGGRNLNCIRLRATS